MKSWCCRIVSLNLSHSSQRDWHQWALIANETLNTTHSCIRSEKHTQIHTHWYSAHLWVFCMIHDCANTPTLLMKLLLCSVWNITSLHFSSSCHLLLHFICSKKERAHHHYTDIGIWGEKNISPAANIALIGLHDSSPLSSHLLLCFLCMHKLYSIHSGPHFSLPHHKPALLFTLLDSFGNIWQSVTSLRMWMCLP